MSAVELLLSEEWQQRLSQCDRLLVGFSGGLDSTVLLHNLVRHSLLSDKLIAVHINHGLSNNASAWQNHCQQFCQLFNIPLLIKELKFPRKANLEEQARQERYAFFNELLTANDCLLLAHHLNDQAETLVLQLARGAGVDGLAAMPRIKKTARGLIARPLLGYSRQDLEDYTKIHQLNWIEDESNNSLIFSRNYLRQQVLPLLAKRWPAIAIKLAQASDHCQQAQANLEDLAKIDCPSLEQRSNFLPLGSLKKLPTARIANVLRYWLKIHQVKIPNAPTFNRLIKEVIGSAIDAIPQVTWGGIVVKRYQQSLYLLPIANSLGPQTAGYSWPSFPSPLDLGIGKGYLMASPRGKGLLILPESKLEVRFRQGGELFRWHGQTKQLKKLFQEWQVPPWLRDTIPLIYINNQLAAVVGYAMSDSFYHTNGDSAYEISHRSSLAEFAQ